MFNSNNLVDWLILLVLIIWFVMDRCEVYLSSVDYEDQDEAPAQIANLREFAYDSDLPKKAEILDQVAKLEQLMLCSDEDESASTMDKPAPRVMYAVQTIEAVCWLAQNCSDQSVVDLILARANFMLNTLWEIEVKANRVSPIFQKVFWDSVTSRLNNQVVYDAHVVYDETINAAGSNGYNVTVTVQPSKAVLRYQFKLSAVL